MTETINGAPRESHGFFGMKRIHIGEHERGLLWVDGECRELLGRGGHSFWDLLSRKRVTVYNRRRPWLDGDDKEAVLTSGLANNELETLELTDNQRAIARVDGRYSAILGPGTHAWWKGLVTVDVATKDIRDNDGAVDVKETPAMFSDPEALAHLSVVDVPARTQCAFFRNGELAALLPPGRHAFWRGSDAHEFRNVDLREQSMDLRGQELLTADKLTLRLNAVLAYRVTDAEKSLLSAADAAQTLYREAQLALRSAVGERDLDSLLADKESLAGSVAAALKGRAAEYGLEAVSFGVIDVVLPGDVRSLLLKATEARKESEAATITRREETAAMRHQLNTARMLADNPALMRLRELETVERIAAGGKLTVVVGDKGIADKVADMV